MVNIIEVLTIFQALCKMIFNVMFHNISQLYEVGTLIFPVLKDKTNALKG